MPTSMPRPIMALATPKTLVEAWRRVADVDGDERAEAADDEHAGGHGEDDEEQSGVVNDEVDALLHVGQMRRRAA